MHTSHSQTHSNHPSQPHPHNYTLPSLTRTPSRTKKARVTVSARTLLQPSLPEPYPKQTRTYIECDDRRLHSGVCVCVYVCMCVQWAPSQVRGPYLFLHSHTPFCTFIFTLPHTLFLHSHTVYDRIFGHFPGKNTVYTPYIYIYIIFIYIWFWPALTIFYGSGQPYLWFWPALTIFYGYAPSLPLSLTISNLFQTPPPPQTFSTDARAGQAEPP